MGLFWVLEAGCGGRKKACGCSSVVEGGVTALWRRLWAVCGRRDGAVEDGIHLFGLCWLVLLSEIVLLAFLVGCSKKVALHQAGMAKVTLQSWEHAWTSARNLPDSCIWNNKGSR